MKRASNLVLLVCVVMVATLATAPAQALVFTHEAYVQNAAQDAITVMWQTDVASDSRVDYGLTSGYGNYVYDPTLTKEHELRITGLDTDTVYHYQVTTATGSETIYSNDTTFQTALAPGTPFTFAIHTDSQARPEVYGPICDWTLAAGARMVIHAGDYIGGWEETFFEPAAPLIAQVPLFGAIGNHEKPAWKYYLYFDMPEENGSGSEKYYSFDYGDAHFIALDVVNTSFKTGTDQYTWVASDLQSTTAEWIFVYFHYPVFTSRGHDADVEEYLVPLFEQYGVDVVFDGHWHFYERAYRNGIYYLLAGCCGGNLAEAGPDSKAPWRQFYMDTDYSFMSADIDGTTCTLYGRYTDGTVFDTWTITHGPPPPPVADFSGNPTAGDEPLDVAFTDLSTYNPTSWDWTFGDGGTSTAQHPSHTYAAGTYTVSLTAENASGSDTETKNDYITANEPQPDPPVADFVGSPLSGTEPLDVDFTDLSTNAPTAWDWTFGDGGTSTAQHPSHTYAEGTYTVSLTATNQYGQDTETKPDYITVTTGGGGDYVCTSMTVEVGTLVSGDHTDTHASDDVRVVVDSAKETGKQSVYNVYTFETGLSSLSSLTVTNESQYSNLGSAGYQYRYVELWDYSSSSWVWIERPRIYTAGADVTTVTNVPSPSNYISAGGEVKARFRHGCVSSQAWTLSVDHMKITAQE